VGVVPISTATPTPSPLGERIFSIARPGSAFFTSVLPTFDVSLDPWLSGPLRLVAGTPDESGIAPLSLGEDVIIGCELVDGSTFCTKLFAAGSGGTIDCDGGSPHATVHEFNSPGTILGTELGADAGPGAASFQLLHTPTQLGVGTTVDDCLDVNYGPGFLTAFTTATSTGVYFNPVQGGDPIVLSKSGENFDCDTWSIEDGVGTLVSPISASNGLVGNVVTILQLSDRVASAPTPEPSPTPTSPPSGTPLGNRTFSISRPGSALRTTTAPGDVSADPWLSGPFVLQAGAVDAAGVAPLTLQSDATYGFALGGRWGALHSSRSCRKCRQHRLRRRIGSFDRADTGQQRCGNRRCTDPDDGPDSGAGATILTAMQAITELPPGAIPADCLAAAFGPTHPIAYTTDMATGTVAEPLQGGSVTIAAEGTNFSCATWTQEDGPGTLVAPRTIVDGAGDDEGQAFVLSD
jgi:hypothetical protein